jgi:hypothetical protein
MSNTTGTSWLKRGCLGCVGLVGLCIVAVVVLAIVAHLSAGSAKPEEQVVTREVPGGVPPTPPIQGSALAAGHVVLDLSDAEFDVRPAAAGEPIRVEASYDKGLFKLEEGLEPGADGGWTYRVSFHSTGSGLWFGIRQFMSHGKNRVRILLPPDSPLALEARISHGGAKVELGGLKLSSADVEVSMGGLELRVSEPLPAPMDSFRLRTSMGGAELRSLGNASPRKLDVEYSMGGMALDLRGLWVADSEITLHGSMGGGEVRVPRDVRLEGLSGKGFEATAQSAPGEIPRPTLRFSAQSAMGDLNFK